MLSENRIWILFSLLIFQFCRTKLSFSFDKLIEERKEKMQCRDFSPILYSCQTNGRWGWWPSNWKTQWSKWPRPSDLVVGVTTTVIQPNSNSSLLLDAFSLSLKETLFIHVLSRSRRGFPPNSDKMFDLFKASRRGSDRMCSLTSWYFYKNSFAGKMQPFYFVFTN